MTTKAEFEQFIATHCPMHARNEPRKERDGEYTYECFDDADGNEVAFIMYSVSPEDGAADVEYVIKTAEA